MNDPAADNSNRNRRIAATGSVVGALLASSCCIVPLVLITLGVSGAWIGTLSALKAYQPLFVVVTVAFLGYGFWRAYGVAPQRCDDDSCATPTSDRLLKTALWTATVLVVSALTTDLWAPFFY